jgi:methylmalonyl-CoA/ethylmalonyl-CoA epimerase
MALAEKISHVAIAVKDLDTAVQTFTRNFGFAVVRRAEAPTFGIALAMLGIGQAALELFTPTKPDSPPARFLDERGEGMYVLSLETADLDAAVQALRAKGVTVGPVTPTADGKGRLVFISPRFTHGVLLELIEHR